MGEQKTFEIWTIIFCQSPYKGKMMAEIEIVHTDITQLKVDAIVNAANNSLLGGGGVDGAIHRVAGPELLAECKTLKGCETGQAKITGGYNLPADYVIHTVGPVWHGGFRNEATLLACCYRGCMRLAAEYHIETIAFPAISCGAYGFPVVPASAIAVSTIQSSMRDCPVLQSIYLVCFGEAVLKAYNQSLIQLTQHKHDK